MTLDAVDHRQLEMFYLQCDAGVMDAVHRIYFYMNLARMLSLVPVIKTSEPYRQAASIELFNLYKQLLIYSDEIFPYIRECIHSLPLLIVAVACGVLPSVGGM